MNNNTKFLVALFVAAAAAAAIAYYLTSDDKEEILEGLKNTAGKIKDELESELEKGKQVVEDLKSTLNDLLNKA